MGFTHATVARKGAELADRMESRTHAVVMFLSNWSGGPISFAYTILADTATARKMEGEMESVY